VDNSSDCHGHCTHVAGTVGAAGFRLLASRSGGNRVRRLNFGTSAELITEAVRPIASAPP